VPPLTKDLTKKKTYKDGLRKMLKQKKTVKKLREWLKEAVRD